MSETLPIQKKQGRIPEGLWLACPNCAQMLYRKQLEKNLSVGWRRSLHGWAAV